MDEGIIDSKDMPGSKPGSARRNSLAGMFAPFLQKQQSMDTDSSDRHQRRGMGGKVKPGKQHSRSNSGDVPDSLAPGPGDVGASSAWHAAAGHDSSSTTPQGWPSNSPAPSTSSSTPAFGLLNKLLSGKKKPKGPHSPTHVAILNSPPLASLSLGASSNGSQSPRSHTAEQLPDYTLNLGAYGRSSSSNGAALPMTPPHHHRHAVDADRVANEEGDYDSCYSTPIGSEAMLSPNQDYGGETLDLRHMVYDAHGDKSPMPMRQDLPEVFTPGFNELLQQAGGRLQPKDPDTPATAAHDEPTVALLTCDQLAQAGLMYDAPAMLLNAHAAHQQQGSAAASRSTSRCHSSMAAGSKAASRSSSAVSSPEPMQPQQHTNEAMCSPSIAAAAIYTSEQQPVCTEDIELHVDAASAAAGGAEAEGAAVEAAEGQSRPASSTPGRSSPTPSRSSATTSTISGAADDNSEVASAPVLAEPAVSAAADVAEDIGLATADAAQPAAGNSKPEAVAASTEDCTSPAGTEQLVVPEAADLSCSEAEEPAAATAKQQTDTVWEAGAAQEAEDEAHNLPTNSSLDETHLAEEEEQTTAAAVEVDIATPEMPAAELAAEVTTNPAAEAAAEPAILPAAAEPAEELAEELAESQAEAGPADAEPVVAVAADAAVAVNTSAAAEELLEKAASFAGDEVDDFALLEQQVIAEVAEEAAVDAFALLEQQVVAEEAEADEFAELERLAAAEAAAEASADSVAAEDSPLGMYNAEELPLPAFEPSEGAELEQPALATEHSRSPDGNSRLSAVGSDDSPVMGLTSSARRAARRSPMNLVRESMPLFLADPSRAMGSPLALQPGEESLDDQDMQQLSAGNAYRGSSSGGGYGATRLLSHGGAQRVSLGGSGLAGGSSFMSSLEPVEEASFSSAGSAIPEGTPSFANQHGSSDSPRSDARCSPAAAGSPGDVSPLHPRRLSSSPSRAQDAAAVGQVTPCSLGGAPNLAMTPGSTYSTPTLAFGASGQDLMTPRSNVSSAIGSAIRASGNMAPLELSPAMPDSMPAASPTLMLMPGHGFDSTVGLQGADGSTPSLLDACAASPSAVYSTRFTATPFRGALAALPMDAALAAPLVDSSPFSLRDDCGMDTVCLADEAQRLAANLTAAAASGAYSPGQASTPMHRAQQAGSPGSASADGRAGSPTGELRELKQVMLTRQLAELQKKNKDLEAENERLKEQVEIYEFEKTELNSQEEMEKQARQYAEEQLQAMQVEMQQLMQARAAQAAQMLALKQEFEVIQRDAQEKHNAMRSAHQDLAAKLAQLQDERDAALDQLNMQDMQNTALKSNNNELMHAVEGEQQRCADLEAALEARERDLADAGRVQADLQAKVEKIMGQVIAADTSKEHYRQKAADEASRVQQMMTQQQQVMVERQQLLAERQQLLAEREKRAQDYQHLKQKYSHKSATLKEAEAKLQAKDAENQELLTMCDQLLQQQEARK